MKVLIAWRASDWQVKIVRQVLGDLAEIDYLKTREELGEKIADADIVIGGPIPDDALKNARRLKFIQATSAGVDKFNFKLLKERGIILASAKGCNAREVAEHALALMLALAKKIPSMDRTLKSGKWIPWKSETMIGDLEGKTVGIIGYGRIGRELAKLCKALGMRILAVKRTPAAPDGVAEFIGGAESLDYVLANSDYVVITLPLTPQTRGLIGEQRLRKMKKTAYLINVGRGPVVDEEALYKALTEGWIAGAGLDVWWEYPPSPDTPSKLGLHKLDNVVASPHKGGWTPKAREKCIRFAAENVRRYILGEKVLNVIDYENPY